MYVRMYACMYVCIYRCICIYVCWCVCVCVCVYLHTYMHTYIHRTEGVPPPAARGSGQGGGGLLQCVSCLPGFNRSAASAGGCRPCPRGFVAPLPGMIHITCIS